MFRLKTIGNSVRTFLLGAKSKEFLVFLFFFALSAGFWLLQTLDETFEREIAIPLQLTDIPEEVVITSPLPDQIRVNVKDKGTSLMRYWRHEITPIQLSFANYDNGTTYGRVRISQADLLKAVQERLISTSKVQAIRPDTLEFYYNHGLHTSVPVTITGEVDTDSHFYLLDVHTQPSEVKVYASSAILDTLTAIPTLPVNLTQLKENTNIDVALRPIRGAKIEPAKVTLTATVDVYMENTIEVPVVSLNFPADRQLQTFPSTVKVTYTVGYARNKEVTRNNFVSVVTYEDLIALQEQGATKIPVRLKTIPEGVTNVRIEPQEIDYLIEYVNGED